jgi:hypothetical protein
MSVRRPSSLSATVAGSGSHACSIVIACRGYAFANTPDGGGGIVVRGEKMGSAFAIMARTGMPEADRTGQILVRSGQIKGRPLTCDTS